MLVVNSLSAINIKNFIHHPYNIDQWWLLCVHAPFFHFSLVQKFTGFQQEAEQAGARSARGGRVFTPAGRSAAKTVGNFLG